jgi:hypothetical protein
LQCAELSTAETGGAGADPGQDTDREWLRATLREMIDEVDRPRAGSVSMLPRLAEMIFRSAAAAFDAAAA